MRTSQFTINGYSDFVNAYDIIEATKLAVDKWHEHIIKIRSLANGKSIEKYMEKPESIKLTIKLHA